jgi:outer membrane receptor protein involved in Fe transport
VELDGEYVFTRNLRLSASYTFLNAVDSLTRLALPLRHRHHGQTRLDYLIPRWGITTNLRGSYYSHWVLNAATGTRGLPFRIWDAYIAKDLRRDIQAFAVIDNLNNSRDGKLQLAIPTFDRPDYGRTLRAGLRYRFSRD